MPDIFGTVTLVGHCLAPDLALCAGGASAVRVGQPVRLSDGCLTAVVPSDLVAAP